MLFSAATRKRQGEWAEACFVAEALSQGLLVSRPFGDSAPYDVIVDATGHLSRVQVKSVCQPEAPGMYRIISSRGCDNKFSYRPDQIDLLAAYIIPQKLWYIIPVAAVTSNKTICLYPAANRGNRLEKYREAWSLLSASGLRL